MTLAFDYAVKGRGPTDYMPPEQLPSDQFPVCLDSLLICNIYHAFNLGSRNFALAASSRHNILSCNLISQHYSCVRYVWRQNVSLTRSVLCSLSDTISQLQTLSPVWKIGEALFTVSCHITHIDCRQLQQKAAVRTRNVLTMNAMEMQALKVSAINKFEV